jgi:peptidoglycan-associated lipoprotein
MTFKLLPALAVALLLAACGSGSDTQPAANSTDALASNGGTTGNNSGGVSQTGAMTSASAAAAQLVAIGNTVHFDTDSSSLNPEAQTLLQKQAAFLQQDRAPTVTIEGHADERGTREYNLALGERRAEAVVHYLVALGIDPARVKEISYGKERPVCPDATDACWAQNRRGVTTLDN